MHYWRFLRQMGWKDTIRYGDYFRFREVGLARRALAGLRVRRALDVGCSGTVFPQYLARLFPEARVVGADNSRFVDLRPAELRRQSVRLGVAARTQFLSADGRRLPFGDGTFDLVTCVSVIEHLEGDGDLELMADLSRVLARGGHLFLTLPMAPTLVEIPASRYCPYFMRYYDAAALAARLLGTAGLVPVSQRGFTWRFWQAHAFFIGLRSLHDRWCAAGPAWRPLRYGTWALQALIPLASAAFLRDWEVESAEGYRRAGGAAILLRKR